MTIDNQQRATIFAQLKRKKKWTGRRNGYRVRIWTRPSPLGIQICYQITKRNLNVAGQSFSLLRCIEYVNEVLSQSGSQTPAPVPAAVLASPKRTEWLPYADN